MKLFNIKTLALATAAASVFFAGSAMAQNTLVVPVNATVQNAITLTLVDPLDFATIVAINDGTQTANATIATDDSIAFATTGAPAFTQQATGTPTAGEFTVAGVTGATINLTLDTVVNPTDGTDTFTLDTFTQSVNGAASAGVTVGTPFNYTATALDTVLIGGRITTPAQVSQIADGAYAGSFTVTASY